MPSTPLLFANENSGLAIDALAMASPDDFIKDLLESFIVFLVY
jgi:hypothetical protein